MNSPVSSSNIVYFFSLFCFFCILYVTVKVNYLYLKEALLSLFLPLGITGGILAPLSSAFLKKADCTSLLLFQCGCQGIFKGFFCGRAFEERTL